MTVNEPYFQDSLRTLYNKSCLDMGGLHDNSVQCVVTSPPYWGLRKYAGEQTISEWGCSYGLEATPELYVEHTVEILREIRRVLRPDGVCFWNIGDSYAGSWGNSGSRDGGQRNITSKKYERHAWDDNIQRPPQSFIKGKRIPRGNGRWGGGNNYAPGLKPKDLCLIPFRVALAAQADGWWIRSVIIWSKNNPMPESVKDRPTASHEYIIMLTKSANYYWDQEAVREAVAPSTIGRGPVDFGGSKGREYQPDKTDPNYRGGSEQWGRTYDYTKASANGRNIRSVWEFSTQPYTEAHFATFPEALPERCIKAASKEGDIILDPFAGSGTTLKVAAELNRRGIGYEISEEYCRLIVNRNRQGVIL